MPWLSIMTRFHALVLVVEEANIELAWKNVKANRGAPGPDGITITEFPDWFRPRWNAVRQQLLEGTYQPQPVRRVTIDKPDGGKRLLGSLYPKFNDIRMCEPINQWID